MATPNKASEDVGSTSLVKRTFSVMNDGGRGGDHPKLKRATDKNPNSNPNKNSTNETEKKAAATKSNPKILRQGVTLGTHDGANLQSKQSPPPVPKFVDPKAQKATPTDLASISLPNSKNFKTVGTQTTKDSVRITKRTANKMSIPYGAIVRINGLDFDLTKYPDRVVSPYFLATVENPYEYKEGEIVRNMTDDDSVVKIILAGRYEWVNQMQQHSCVRVYPNHKLTMIKPPPADDARLSKQEKKGFLRWFSKPPGKW